MSSSWFWLWLTTQLNPDAPSRVGSLYSRRRELPGGIAGLGRGAGRPREQRRFALPAASQKKVRSLRDPAAWAACKRGVCREILDTHPGLTRLGEGCTCLVSQCFRATRDVPRVTFSFDSPSSTRCGRWRWSGCSRRLLLICLIQRRSLQVVREARGRCQSPPSSV